MYGAQELFGVVERIGRYEVLGHLASGGMGQVYLARTRGLGGFERQVVVKTLDPDPTDEDSLVAMFLDEARLLGALHHQYIAPVYEVGLDEDGRYYLVMDYVRGETAETVWKASSDRGSALPIAFALTVGSAIASALDYAHSLVGADGAPLHVVHRDVSLSNVMIGHDGAVKLIDFGIAKFSNRASHTQVGTLKGKLAYLSPEQVLHRNVDRRADIFSLGVVLYELTTMSRAFYDNSELLTLERIIRGDLVPPSQRAEGYPLALEAIVMKALATDPAQRFQDAGALGRELERFAARAGLPLGHAPLIDVMRRLFDSETGLKRRLARSSSEIPTDKRAKRHDEANQVTPVVAIEVAEDTVPTRQPGQDGPVTHGPREMPVEIVNDQPTTRMVTPQKPFPVANPEAPTIAVPPLEMTPLQRPRTATAEIAVRPEKKRRRSRAWWLVAGLVAIGIGIAAALGLT